MGKIQSQYTAGVSRYWAGCTCCFSSSFFSFVLPILTVYFEIKRFSLTCTHIQEICRQKTTRPCYYWKVTTDIPLRRLCGNWALIPRAGPQKYNTISVHMCCCSIRHRRGHRPAASQPDQMEIRAWLCTLSSVLGCMFVFLSLCTPTPPKKNLMKTWNVRPRSCPALTSNHTTRYNTVTFSDIVSYTHKSYDLIYNFKKQPILMKWLNSALPRLLGSKYDHKTLLLPDVTESGPTGRREVQSNNNKLL